MTSELSGGVLQLVLDAGPVAKAVLVTLLGFSVVSWAILIGKYRRLARARRHTAAFMKAFRETRRPAVALDAARKCPASPLARVYVAAWQELTAVHGEDLAQDRLEAIHRAMRRASAHEASRLERHLTVLATTASATPFIGLFGTVWGIMAAFQGIGAQGAASLAVVAPGISEALIATAAGLAAAIPAVVAYNYFVANVRSLAVDMDAFALDVLNLLSRPVVTTNGAGKDATLKAAV